MTLIKATVVLLLFVSAACEDPLPQAEETPPRTFVARDVFIDDTQADGSQWRGKAARAEGGLDESDFEKIELTITTRDPERSYLVLAPRGTMNFDTHQGVFQDMVMTGEDGARLRAGVGRYDGNTGLLATEGPMHFEANGMVMRAPRGIFDLRDGGIEVEGPVNGRYSSESVR